MPEKPFVKVRPTYSVKLVFSYVVKRRKTKITAKFRASERLRFEDTKRIVTRNTPEKFRDFRETGSRPEESTLASNWFSREIKYLNPLKDGAILSELDVTSKAYITPFPAK